MKVVSVVGARPNFMKIAPFCRAVEQHNAEARQDGRQQIEHVVVHTGQHYDNRMSEDFFRTLGIPPPGINLEVGSGSHAEQVGRTMIEFEKALRQLRAEWVVVVGDVNATCACSITAKKDGVRLAHIEAGLRSGDMGMPEEINRLITDRLSDLLFTPDRWSSENLRAEGIPADRIRMVGNIMIDTLEAHRQRAADLCLAAILAGNRPADDSAGSGAADKITQQGGSFALVTLHRPSNVDRAETLSPIVRFLVEEVAPRTPCVWPVHPRTRMQLVAFGLWARLRSSPEVILLDPLGYDAMLRLNMGAAVVLTDSGGLQEECCVLGTPCLTLRWNTERPATLREHGGASVLVGNSVERMRTGYAEALQWGRAPMRPPLWDGMAAGRIVDALVRA